MKNSLAIIAFLLTFFIGSVQANHTSYNTNVKIHDVGDVSLIDAAMVYQALQLAQVITGLKGDYPAEIWVFFGEDNVIVQLSYMYSFGAYYCVEQIDLMCPPTPHSIIIIGPRIADIARVSHTQDDYAVYLAVLTHEIMHHLMFANGIPMEQQHPMMYCGGLEEDLYNRLGLDYTYWKVFLSQECSTNSNPPNKFYVPRNKGPYRARVVRLLAVTAPSLLNSR